MQIKYGSFARNIKISTIDDIDLILTFSGEGSAYQAILQESKMLLKHSKWSVAEIAYALGFTEVTHFNIFFKKHVLLSPLKFRNA